MDDDDAPTPESDDRITLASREEAFAELADLNDEPDQSDALGSPRPDEPTTGDEVAPPVVLVVVTHDAEAWLDDVLESLGQQTYTNLSVLVIDAASSIDPTPQVARVLPGAFVRRLESNLGFGPTVDEILDLVSGASFYCICHDDVALDPDCVHELVAEAFRSNAAVVGPKIVDWDEPEKLLSVGFTIDRAAGRAPYAEHHELDQGQHDAVRDVFAVEGACMLVRSDLFSHLGGFDPEIDLLGEDLDFCWRTHLVGARVVVAPRAKVRHRECLDERIDQARLTRVGAVHRVRALLANYRLGHLGFLLPQLLMISLIEAVVEGAIGRRAAGRALLRAWGTNFGAGRSILRSRRRVRSVRETGDRTIMRLQTKTSARLDGLVQAHRRDRERAALDASETGAPSSDALGAADLRPARRSGSLTFWGVVALVAVAAVGTRDLFFGPLPSVGSFASAHGGLGSLWRSWLSSWNAAGLGSNHFPAAGAGPLAIFGTLFGGSLGFMRRVAILGAIPVGMFGVWRLSSMLSTRRAQLAALAFYVAVPVPWNALSQGTWAGLIIYACAPWIFRQVVMTLGETPFIARRADSEYADRVSADRANADRAWAPILGFGLLLAVVGSVVPAVAGVAVVVAFGVAIGSVFLGRFGGLGRLGGTTVGAVAVGGALLVPWTVVGPGSSWWAFAGLGSGVHGWLGPAQILRFQSGSAGSGILGYAFVVAALLPLVIGRSWRFAWAVRSWAVAVACFGVVWVGQQSWSGLPLPPPEVFLAPAALALAMATACGVAAVEADLPSLRFGWAQGATVVATVALVAAMVPFVGNATDGRWKMAPVGFDAALDFLGPQRADRPFRVLWLGDPAVMPVAGWPLDSRTMVGTSDHGTAALNELWAPGDPGPSAALIRSLDLAMRSQTTRLGRILAEADIRYVVLPRQIAPLPYHPTAHPVPATLLASLDDQLDLARMPVNDALVVYRNDAWHPGLSLYHAKSVAGSSVVDVLDAPERSTVVGRVDPTSTSIIRVFGAGVLATGQPADRSWRLTVNGRTAKPVTLWGWEQGFVVTGAGVAKLHRTGGTSRVVVLVAMIGLWVAVSLAWVFGRRRREDELVLGEDEDAAGPGSLVRLGSSDQGLTTVSIGEVRVGDQAEQNADDTDAEAGEQP